MKRWALLKDGIKIKTKDFPDYYSWEGRKVDSDLEWLELIIEPAPTYDNKTQKISQGEGKANGKWKISHNIISLTVEELEEIKSNKDSAISAFTRIKSVLQLDNAKTKQFLRDTNEIMSYLDELED